LNPIKFNINGEATAAEVRADMTVLEWLRANPLLRGTKEGCAEGDCGACSILLARPASGEPEFNAVNSCILLMGQIEGCSLITVEGLTSMQGQRHPVQAEMAENGSSQCGFCTPGVAVSLAGLLSQNGDPNEDEIHDALAGNLCRCTGYRPIVEAAISAVSADIDRLQNLGDMGIRAEDTAIAVGNDQSVFFRPKSLEELCTIKSEHPNAVLLAGGTDLGLNVAQAKARWSMAIVTSAVSEMLQIEEHEAHVSFGGAVTWEQALPWLRALYPSFGTLVRRFGSAQVRAQGTIAGNIGNASPIGDGPPALIALGASVILASVRGEREVMLEDFCTGYRQTVMQSDEVISQVKLPWSRKNQLFRVYKISKRYDQDISTVCGAFSVITEGEEVKDARIAYGGMAATSQRCPEAEKALIGQELSLETAKVVAEAVTKHFTPLSDGRGSADYRTKVAANLCERFIRDVSGETVEVMDL